MRLWPSGQRVLAGLVRTSISTGPEDIHPHLPSWRRFQLRRQLQEKAMADGKHMTSDAADYVIDKAFATGLLDSDGCLNFRVRGTREEIVAAIMETTASWGRPMNRAEAEEKADEAITVAMPLWVQLAFWAVMLASLAYIIASAWGR